MKKPMMHKATKATDEKAHHGKGTGMNKPMKAKKVAQETVKTKHSKPTHTQKM